MVLWARSQEGRDAGGDRDGVEVMMKIPRFTLILVLLPALLAVLTCEKSPSPSGFTYNDKTRIPEDNSGLLDVLVRNDTITGIDTVYLIYSPGATKPTYQAGDILFGKLHNGYMKKVASTEIRGDTLVVLSEQASLPDVFSYLHVDTVAHMGPGEVIFPDSSEFDAIGVDGCGITTKYKVSLTFKTPRVEYPDSQSVRVIIPDLALKIRWPTPESTNVAYSLTVSELIYTTRMEIDAFIHIGADSTACNFSYDGLDSLELRGFAAKGSVTLDVNTTICTARSWYFLGPVPVTIEFPIKLGVVSGVAAEVSVDASLIGWFERSAWFKVSPFRYHDGDIDIKPGGDFEFRGITGEFSFWVEPYLQAELGTYIAGCAGPYFAIRPNVRCELAVPPVTVDCKVGVSGEVGAKLKFLSSNWELKVAWEFLDKKWPLYYQRELLSDGFESYPLGQGIGSPWTYEVRPASWLGIVQEGTGGGKCLELSDTSFAAGGSPPDYDSSYAWVIRDVGQDYDEMSCYIRTDDPQCDIGFRGLGDPSDSATCSWYVNVFDGALQYNDGTLHSVAGLESGRWYLLKLRIDWASKVYDISLDGTRVKNDAPFRGSNGQGSKIVAVDFTNSLQRTPGVLFDDLWLWTHSREGESWPRPVPYTSRGGNLGWR
jgi:hypothetical protein